MTHKERMLKAIRGEMPDQLPYAPRIDLWYYPNAAAGTLPERHRGRSADEITRAEGWALHHVVVDYFKGQDSDGLLHRAIGIQRLREHVYRFTFSPNIDIQVHKEGAVTRIEYHTPKGVVWTETEYSEEMKRSGVGFPWISKHIVKCPQDLEIVGSLFENIDVVPFHKEFLELEKEIGEDGLAVTTFTNAASPMQHIQKYFLDATEFFIYYRDYYNEMRDLAERMEPFFERGIRVIADSPTPVVNWGANYDDMITYPPYFEKELLPWLRKASAILSEKGKYLLSHCDGENLGLLDLIRDSGIHIAEAVCPYPMTKVKIEDYYRKWGDKITIFGGIPSTMLLKESTTEEDLDAYLDQFFKAIAPGRRFIVGIADSTPPNAVFERLVHIGDRVEKEGRLLLEAGGANPLNRERLEERMERAIPSRQPVSDKPVDEGFSSKKEDRLCSDPLQTIQNDVLKGDAQKIKVDVKILLDRGHQAGEILNLGMLPAMETIGKSFTDGSVFIPEVLLSARAMNEALTVLEPYLSTGDSKAKGKILIGTVKGDFHDIGKNIVLTMLKGIGFETVDLGINVPAETFVRQVLESKPDVLALSALLTTTMPQMGVVVESLKKAGLREGVKIIVGGAPVNEKFAQGIGADGYARDAGEAARLVKGLLEKR